MTNHTNTNNHTSPTPPAVVRRPRGTHRVAALLFAGAMVAFGISTSPGSIRPAGVSSSPGAVFGYNMTRPIPSPR